MRPPQARPAKAMAHVEGSGTAVIATKLLEGR